MSEEAKINLNFFGGLLMETLKEQKDFQRVVISSEQLVQMELKKVVVGLDDKTLYEITRRVIAYLLEVWKNESFDGAAEGVFSKTILNRMDKYIELKSKLARIGDGEDVSDELALERIELRKKLRRAYPRFYSAVSLYGDVIRNNTYLTLLSLDYCRLESREINKRSKMLLSTIFRFGSYHMMLNTLNAIVCSDYYRVPIFLPRLSDLMEYEWDRWLAVNGWQKLLMAAPCVGGISAMEWYKRGMFNDRKFFVVSMKIGHLMNGSSKPRHIRINSPVGDDIRSWVNKLAGKHYGADCDLYMANDIVPLFIVYQRGGCWPNKEVPIRSFTRLESVTYGCEDNGCPSGSCVLQEGYEVDDLMKEVAKEVGVVVLAHLPWTLFGHLKNLCVPRRVCKGWEKWVVPIELPTHTAKVKEIVKDVMAMDSVRDVAERVAVAPMSSLSMVSARVLIGEAGKKRAREVEEVEGGGSPKKKKEAD